MAIQITCIRKANGDHENPYIAISSMNWKEDVHPFRSGTASRLDMYKFVVNDHGTAYVKDVKGHVAYLTGAISPKGNEYVKTLPDDVKSDNLLKLPECP